jgi:hypothetical protein
LAVLDPVHGAVGVNPLRKVAEASVYHNTTLYMNNKQSLHIEKGDIS